jgi:hypothetical protein
MVVLPAGTAGEGEVAPLRRPGQRGGGPGERLLAARFARPRRRPRAAEGARDGQRRHEQRRQRDAGQPGRRARSPLLRRGRRGRTSRLERSPSPSWPPTWPRGGSSPGLDLLDHRRGFEAAIGSDLVRTGPMTTREESHMTAQRSCAGPGRRLSTCWPATGPGRGWRPGRSVAARSAPAEQDPLRAPWSASSDWRPTARSRPNWSSAPGRARAPASRRRLARLKPSRAGPAAGDGPGGLLPPQPVRSGSAVGFKDARRRDGTVGEGGHAASSALTSTSCRLRRQRVDVVHSAGPGRALRLEH